LKRNARLCTFRFREEQNRGGIWFQNDWLHEEVRGIRRKGSPTEGWSARPLRGTPLRCMVRLIQTVKE